jgi:hypothetical protein
MEDLRNYDALKAAAEKLYESTKPVYCPALREEVQFTSVGFRHLVVKSSGDERGKSSQMDRFELLRRAIRLIGTASNCQEFEEREDPVRLQVRGRTVGMDMSIRFWGIVGRVDGRKLKVVLRKVGHGTLHFWSVMPIMPTAHPKPSPKPVDGTEDS